jgi:hypothetical protein
MESPGTEIVGLIALLPEIVHGLVATSAAGAAEQQGAILRKAFLGQNREKVEGKMDTPRGVPALELHIGADIHHQSPLAKEVSGLFGIDEIAHHLTSPWPRSAP